MTCAHHARPLDPFGVCAECEAAVDAEARRAERERSYPAHMYTGGYVPSRPAPLPVHGPWPEMPAGVTVHVDLDVALRMPRGEVTHHPGRIRRAG